MDKPLKVIESRNSRIFNHNERLTWYFIRPGLVALLLAIHVALTVRLNTLYPDSFDYNLLETAVIIIYPVIASFLIGLFAYSWSVFQALGKAMIYLPFIVVTAGIVLLMLTFISSFGSIDFTLAENAARGLILLVWAALYAISCFLLNRSQELLGDQKSYYRMVMLFAPMSLIAISFRLWHLIH